MSIPSNWEQQLTAFGFVFQAIAIRLYPAIFATGFLERVLMCDHAQIDVPPPILTRNVLVKATGGLVATSGEINPSHELLIGILPT